MTQHIFRLWRLFFAECEEIIVTLREIAGNGYIIGDGAIFFFSMPPASKARDIITSEITGRLRRAFHDAADKMVPGHGYKLSFAAGYCNFHIRRGVDLVGPEIDQLFGLLMSAKDEAILINDHLFRLLDDI